MARGLAILAALALVAVALPAALSARGGSGDAAPPVLGADRPLPERPAERRAERPRPAERPRERRRTAPRQPSRAIGKPNAGRLAGGVRLPLEGTGYVTWDPVFDRVPNRTWRLWGTDRLVLTLERVLADFARDNPGAPPVLVGDLSRPRGGDFGPRYGSVGHASHQNGLDADVYYPRRDRRLIAPRRAADVDRRLAQELVDRFVAEGAQFVFVGQTVGLTGPPNVVQRIPLHDDHLHLRLLPR